MQEENWKRQWLLLCLADHARKSKYGETRSKTNDFKSKFACILEASQSTRMRMEESLPKDHEDHIAGRGDNSLQHYNLVHKFIPMPQAMKIPAAKAAVVKEWEKLEKIPAWDLTKVRNKSEVVEEARTKGAKVPFASLMDICHVMNAELETKHQKYKGRVVLRGDTVKDDSGSYAVFTEQGSSASQMTAARVMDIWIRLPRRKWRGSVRSSLAGLLRERQFEKILSKYCWEKVSKLRMSFSYTVKKGLFLSVYVDDIKLAGKKQNLDPMWKVLNKEVDLGEPTSFLDHVSLVCTQRQCEISEDIVDNYRNMFESIISAGASEKTCSENLCISSWSYDMEGHAKKCVERYCELANKRRNNSTKYQFLALTTISSKKKN